MVEKAVRVQVIGVQTHFIYLFKFCVVWIIGTKVFDVGEGEIKVKIKLHSCQNFKLERLHAVFQFFFD
jgi:hypothetical protein